MRQLMIINYKITFLLSIVKITILYRQILNVKSKVYLKFCRINLLDFRTVLPSANLIVATYT